MDPILKKLDRENIFIDSDLSYFQSTKKTEQF
jgi:hypothetical protein